MSKETATHAHLRFTSRDCDGVMLHGYDIHADELDNPYGWTFEELLRDTYGQIEDPSDQLTDYSNGFEHFAYTEEGYNVVRVTFCDCSDAGRTPWQRDLAAEAAGY